MDTGPSLIAFGRRFCAFGNTIIPAAAPACYSPARRSHAGSTPRVSRLRRGVEPHVSPIPPGRSSTLKGDLADRVFYLRTGMSSCRRVEPWQGSHRRACWGPENSSGKGAWPVSVGGWDRRSPGIASRLMAIPLPGNAPCCEQHAMSDLFIAKILARSIRIEEDLVDQLFNSSEKRLARTLLRLACYGQIGAPTRSCRRFPRRHWPRSWARPARASTSSCSDSASSGSSRAERVYGSTRRC